MRALALVIVVALAGQARADGELRSSLAVDGTIALAGTFIYTISEFFLKPSLVPDECRWCEVNGLDENVREALKWDDTTAAHWVSNVTGYVLAPVSALALTAVVAAHDDRLGNWGQDALIIYEAAIIAANVNQVTKLAVGRQRPYVHFMTGMPSTTEDNLSFYSGHTTWAFAFATSAGTVASMRHYRWAPLVWGSGMALAVTTGYMRIAADRHYFTDVLTGAVIGGAIGVVVPYYFHRGRGEAVKVGIAPGPMLQIAGKF